MYFFLAALIILGSFSSALSKDHGHRANSAEDKRFLFGTGCSTINLGYQESSYVRRVWFLRNSTEKCDDQCTISMAEPIAGNKIEVLYHTTNWSSSNDSYTVYQRVGKFGSQYTFTLPTGESGVRNIPKITNDYYIDSTKVNGKEVVQIWSTSPSMPMKGITYNCGNGKNLKDCKAEQKCKKSEAQEPIKNMVCLANFPEYQEEMYTNVTWFLKNSTEQCDTVCTTTMAEHSGNTLKVYTLQGYANPTTIEYTRIDNTSTYSFPSQNGGTSNGTYNVAYMGNGYYVNYTIDNGKEIIGVYVTSPFIKAPAKLFGCGEEIKLNNCNPEVNCLKGA